MARVPELAARAQDVAECLKIDIAHGDVRILHRILPLREQRGCGGHRRLHVLQHLAALAELRLRLVLDELERVEAAGDVEAERGRGLGRGPHVREALRHVLLHLESLLVAGRRFVHARRAAEARALVADHGLDGAHERTRAHHAHAHARLGEDLRDDFGVCEVRHDLSVLDRVAAHDARGGHDDVDHGVARVGKLVHALERLRAAVKLAGVRGLHDHHAAALDAVVAGVDGHGDVVGDRDVGDEATALLDAQLRLLALLPLGHAHAPAEDARIDAHVGKRLRERERPAPRLARLVAGRAARHVVGLLLVRTELGDRTHREAVHERGRRGAVVHPT